MVQREAFANALRFGQLKSRDVLTVDKAIDFLCDERRLQVDWLFLLPTTKDSEMEQAL